MPANYGDAIEKAEVTANLRKDAELLSERTQALAGLLKDNMPNVTDTLDHIATDEAAALILTMGVSAQELYDLLRPFVLRTRAEQAANAKNYDELRDIIVDCHEDELDTLYNFARQRAENGSASLRVALNLALDEVVYDTDHPTMTARKADKVIYQGARQHAAS